MTRYQVYEVWEWEDRDGEPQIKIGESVDGYVYDDPGTAGTAARALNSIRSKNTIAAGKFYEAMSAEEVKAVR